MGKKSDATARDLLGVATLLMRRLGARMRQGEPRIEPAHIGILARLRVGTCSLSALAAYQSVRLPTMSRSVGLLVGRGWVERSIPEDNRRQTMVALTAEGRRVFSAMRRRAEREVADMLSSLTVEERERVQRGLRILLRALDLKGVVPEERSGEP
jgi:DNA-binding MarR family transcriptional regulator